MQPDRPLPAAPSPRPAGVCHLSMVPRHTSTLMFLLAKVAVKIPKPHVRAFRGAYAWAPEEANGYTARNSPAWMPLTSACHSAAAR
jgi:hypothetical protein